MYRENGKTIDPESYSKIYKLLDGKVVGGIPASIDEYMRLEEYIYSNEGFDVARCDRFEQYLRFLSPLSSSDNFLFGSILLLAQKLKEKRATTPGAADSTIESLKNPHNLWTQFLLNPSYGNLTEAEVYSLTPENIEKQQRAFMEWLVKAWDAMADSPSPYLKGFKNIEITGLGGEERKLVDFINPGTFPPEHAALTYVLFGILPHLEYGNEAYVNQLKVHEILSMFENIKTNPIDHLFHLPPMSTGELTASHYLQYAMQYLILCDAHSRAWYINEVKDHLGEDVLKRFFPDANKSYSPQDKLLHEEAKKAGADVIEVKKTIANFVLAQDAIHGNPAEPLSQNDALFIADLAICACELYQVFAEQDNDAGNYISRRFPTRWLYTQEYRRRKISQKGLGSPVSLEFFRVFFTSFTKYQMRKGISLEQLWMLSGAAKPDVRIHYGVPDDITKIKLRDEKSPFSTDMGALYRRTGEFVEKMWDILTGKQKMISDWFSEGLPFDQSVRSVHNDTVGYYFGDLEQGASKEWSSAELEHYKKLYAEHGYVLVKGKKIDPDNPGFYLDKDGKQTRDASKARTTSQFTPAFTYFNIIPDHSPESLVEMSLDDPKKFQEIVERSLGTDDVFSAIRLRLVEWLIINELDPQREAFRHKKKEDQVKIIERIFAMLNQDAFSARYLHIKEQILGDRTQQAGFGLMSIASIERILETVEFVRPLDIHLKLTVAKIKTQAALARGAISRPLEENI